VNAWTYDGYWAAVLGACRGPAMVLFEFGLDAKDRRGLDEWLGEEEAEAWRVGGHGGELPEEWSTYHAQALAALEAAS
jgi:hypothetical protein